MPKNEQSRSSSLSKRLDDIGIVMFEAREIINRCDDNFEYFRRVSDIISSAERRGYKNKVAYDYIIRSLESPN